MIHNYKYTQNAFLPKTVLIPLVQEKNDLCKPVIKIGEIVTEGQIIASSDSSAIHSPVPGTVNDICPVHCPDGKIEKALKISTKGSFSYLGKELKAEEWQSLSPASLERKLDEKGILNTFSCSHPLSLTEQIKNSFKLKNQNLIVRLFDEDNLRISDSLMTSFYFDQVREGAQILAKIIDAQSVIFVMNPKDIKEKNLENDDKHKIYYFGLNPKKYLNGFKFEIINTFNKSMQKSTGIKLCKTDFFTDPYTMYDIYNAVVYNIPVMTQTVHFTGNCIPSSSFLNVRIGFTLKELVNQLGGLIKNPEAVIINGKTVGSSVTWMDVPVTKAVKSIEFISKANTTDSQVYTCVKCGSCRYNCPVGIAPDMLYEYVLKHIPMPQQFIKTATFCINCGKCNTVCQARIPLCQVITLLKDKLDEK